MTDVLNCFADYRAWRAGRLLVNTGGRIGNVARHLALDTLRRQHVSPADFADHADHVAVERRGVAETVTFEEDIRGLAGALATLPPRAREIVMLRKFDGVPVKEIALRLDISEKTVEVHLTRGLKRLGEQLRRRGLADRYLP